MGKEKTYYVVAKYDGFPQETLDNKLEKLYPKKYCGSGFCFFTGKRENDWFDLSRKEADKIVTKARKLTGVTAVIRLQEW